MLQPQVNKKTHTRKCPWCPRNLRGQRDFEYHSINFHYEQFAREYMGLGKNIEKRILALTVGHGIDAGKGTDGCQII
jgi:hypothetical protein